ncbi:MAG TPA: 50S ribosomal protein L15 [Pirellulales bacterium]|jgi:large subunit ribosomal protein L15|nr:50S ribosomal protein L15 [Pirellulales bacterium]
MNLSDVNRGIHKHKKRKRVGRGPGSGHGKTSGRGHKGQGALAGWTAPAIFEGGASPLIRRIPKRGFNNAWAKEVFAINLGALNDAYESGQEVTIDSLREKHLARGRFDELKILGNGELTKKLKISAHRFSESAKAKIEQAGGQAIVLPGKKPIVKGQRKNGAAATK